MASITRANFERFETLEPLNDYLAALENVTRDPNAHSITEMEAVDELLTSKTHLYPPVRFGSSRYSEEDLEFTPITISDGVIIHANLADLEPDSQEYIDAYRTYFTNNVGIDIDFDSDGKPTVEILTTQVPERNINRNMGSLASRQNAARVALIELGGRLATSGAFDSDLTVPAYEAVVGTLDGLAGIAPFDGFTEFGVRRISRDLLNQRLMLKYTHDNELLLPKDEAHSNIDAAWSVVGRPFGPFSKLVSSIARVPHF